MASQKWILLDFDNCQMATEHLAVPSLIARFNELYGDQIDSLLTFDEFKKHFLGQTRESLCQNLSKYFGIDVEYTGLYENREWKMMQIFQQVGVEMADFLIETLESLQAKGYKFAFVSNNPIQRGLTAMRFAMNGQGDRLARLFGTSFFEAGDVQKPKPDVYLRAMEQLMITPENCYVVEDSPTGVKAAVGAGILTFGFLGFTDDKQAMAQILKAKGAAACFEQWREFPSLLSLMEQS